MTRAAPRPLRPLLNTEVVFGPPRAAAVASPDPVTFRQNRLTIKFRRDMPEAVRRGLYAARGSRPYTTNSGEGVGKVRDRNLRWEQISE